jgi:phosphoribosylformimino-5-aminoimidazole carboxamide ribotide isomerase
MDVIPAIDLLEGRCVRLYQGDYARSQVFNDHPTEVAKQWVDQGATRLHVVDLDGAKAGQSVNAKAIEAIVQAVPVPVQVGGGLRDRVGVAQMLECWRPASDLRHGSCRKNPPSLNSYVVNF